MLKKNEFRAGSALLTLFTENAGIMSASAHGIHSMKNGVASAAQPFTCGEFTLTHKNNHITVKNACILESFGSFSSTYEGLLSMTRLVRSAALIFSEGQTHENPHDAFRLLYTAMSYTAYSNSDAEDIYIYFLLHAMSLSGQAPSVTNCAVCSNELYSEPEILFSPRHGGAVCAHCAGGQEISRLSLEAMRRMLILPTEEMNKVILPEKVRHELADLLGNYLDFWFK